MNGRFAPEAVTQAMLKIRSCFVGASVEIPAGQKGLL
jgi:hypothetical protein